MFAADPGAPLAMTNRQEATVIAALQVWRALLTGCADLAGAVPDLPSIASDGGLHDPLTADEVGDLLATNFRVEI